MTQDATNPPRLALRARGSFDALDAASRLVITDRASSLDPTIGARTSAIIARVRADGDTALRAMAREFDGVDLDAIDVPRARWTAALEALDPSLRAALERAARNIATVHAAFLPQAVTVSPEPGITIGRRPDPLARVGVYAPGGRAAYPSSLLMGAIPARVAGVGEVIVCSPPGADGLPSPVVLAAAALANVDRVFAVGGAGAIAAMAYGTATIPRVDRVVGPGNAYVAEAKLQLVAHVAIDAPAGPSEILVLADDSADVTAIAREMLAQAEHDPDAAVLAILCGEDVATLSANVERALAELVGTTPREAIVRASLAARGAILTAPSLARGVAIANDWAAEHLLLLVRETERDNTLAALRHAGTVFVGASSSVAFGDYMTGANHVLPTAGAARRYSGLSTLDFVRWTTWQDVSPHAAAALADDVGRFADAEALPAHAAAARAWRTHVAHGALDGSRRVTTPTDTPRLAFARAAYEGLALYDPQRAPVEIDLTDNTNLWGMPPAAERTLRTIPVSSVTRYPTLYAAELKAALADYVGVRPDMIVTGCGSDDILDSAMRALAEPGDLVVGSDPTFGMLPIFAQMNALRWRGIPELTDAPMPQPDIDAMLATDARMIYLCSPNNPTGALIARASIERVVREARGVVCIDEAYAEFAGVSSVDLLAHSDRVLIVRTLSKAFGLAGLRVGYAIGQPALVNEVEKSRGPYKLNALAERVALTALREDRAWIDEHVQLAITLRERLAEELRTLGLSPMPSAANFLCVPMANVVTVGQALRARGVAARPFPALPGVGDALRISVGPWPMLQRLLDALPAAMAEATP